MRYHTVLTIAATVILAACGPGPEVVQGIVVATDMEHNQLVVQSDDTAIGDITFDISDAEIGTPPEVGDKVRVAFRTVDDTHAATRVMNVSRQEGSRAAGH